MADEAKAAIVTGAAGGIGRATCERLARGGWQVLAVDRDAGPLGWTEGTAVAGCAADVTSAEDNARVVAEAERRFGRLDGLVLNAGVACGGNIDDLPFEAFRRAVEVNLFGTVLGIRAALPLMRRGGDGGAIAVTSSAMGVAGDAENWAYSASKHALIGLVRSLSREIGWSGIRINALCPGLTRDTGMTRFIEAMGPEAFQASARPVPLGRWAEPDEMAGVLEFLVSPASSYVNGHALVADGGAVTGTGLLGPKTNATPIMPVED